MRLTFLGTGTSFGIPVIGCSCATCTSADPRDRRTRHGALVTTDEGARILVDTPPELRLQLVREGVDRIDAVWLTHPHADHLHGLDDLRIFTTRQRTTLPTYVPEAFVGEIVARFPYIFDDGVQPPEGTTKPEIRIEPFGADPVEVAGVLFRPIEVPHPPISAWGFRVADLGYVTDAKTLPDEAIATLEGVRVLVLNALWFGDPHPTHLVVEEAVEVAGRVGAGITYLTHLTHRVRHEDLEARLPAHVRPAHDGLTLDIE